jgi:hypothetical protein
MNRRVLAYAFLAFAIAPFLAGAQQPTVPTVEVAPFELNVRPTVVSRLASRFEARSVPAAQLVDITGGDKATAAGSVAGLGAEAVAGSPQAASALVAAAPIFLAIGIHNQNKESRRSRLEQALREANVPLLMESSLNSLFREESAQGASDVMLEVLINDYGLRSGYISGVEDIFCFVLHAEIVLTAKAREVYRAQVLLGSSAQSDEVPPPSCASLAKLAENDARQLHQIITDYTDTLAAIAAHRLPALPWK